jgi:hypothetical protein
MNRGAEKKLKKLQLSANKLYEEKKWAEMTANVDEILRMIACCDNCGQSRMNHLNETKCLFNATDFKASP